MERLRLDVKKTNFECAFLLLLFVWKLFDSQTVRERGSGCAFSRSDGEPPDNRRTPPRAPRPLGPRPRSPFPHRDRTHRADSPSAARSV